jgi:hypothetical protein
VQPNRPRIQWHSFLLRLLHLLCLAFFVCGSAQSATGSGGGPPAFKSLHAFTPGERLTYSIAWFTIPAGTTVMEVAEGPVVAGHSSYRFVTTAKTNKFVSRFYPVDSRVESITDPVSMLPQRLFFKRREGKRKNDFDVTFYHAEGKVSSIKDGVQETIAIPQEVQDGLSCLYYLRSLPALVPGTSIFVNVHHDRKNYRVEVRVEGVEKLNAPWGEVETLRLLAVMPFQGIFLNEGNIRIWVTNDPRHIPVLMRAKVVMGSVTATLVDGAGAR